MPAAMALSHRVIGDLVLGLCYGGGGLLVVALSADVKQHAGEEQEYPQENIDDPPPRPNENPPQTSVTLFLVLRVGFRDSLTAEVLLEGLVFDVAASAFRACLSAHR